MKKSTFFKFLLSAILVFGNVFAFSQNILSIGDYNADVNAQTTISVNLANEDVAAAIQMDIPLDESITYVSGSFSLTSRTSTHMSNAQIVNTNTLRVLLFAFPTTAFSGNDGPIFTFDVIGTEAGTFELNPESVVLSSMSGGPLSCIVVNGSLTVAAATFDVTVAANPAVGGIVTGAGTYEEGASVTIAATANVGYTFANWTEEGAVVSTAASYTFTITEDHDFIANFTLNTYDVTVAANPAEGGTVTGAGTYNYGASVTIEASANDGYTFANWKEGDAVVSEDAAYTFTITDDHDFIAYFDEQIVNYYTVSVTAVPTEGGTVIGAGTYEEGTSVTIEASANAGYTFAFWKEGDAVISPNASYTFTITEDHDFVAYFTINTYDVTVAANPAEGGIVVGAGTYEEGASVTIAATANIGYSFANWTEEGTVVSTVAYYTFIITEDHDFIANFTLNTYDVTVEAYPAEGGSVAGAGTYDYGTSVTIEATANVGYTFAIWTEGAAIVSEEASYTFIITDDHDFIAYFAINTYDVTVTANPAEGGTVTGEGNYDYGTSVTIEAYANAGYTFANWTEGDAIVSEDASYTFTITEDHDFIANFTLNTYDVTVAANPAEGGTVTGAGTYDYGTSVTIEASANNGYTFAYWTEGDAIVTEDASYTFTITEDHDFIANFTLNTYDVTVAANPVEGGSVTGAGTYDYGTSVTIEASANDGYTFAYWTEGDAIVSENASYTFTITEDHDFIANFDEVIINYYTVILTANPSEGGIVTGEGTFEEGTSVTIEASANDGYTFAYWTEGDAIVSEDASYTFTITEDHDFIAHFPINTYDVTVTANPVDGGTVTGEGTYIHGTSVTIEAYANAGYTFAYWTEGDAIVSTDASYTFTITEDHDFIANFEEIIINYYTVTLTANPAEGGTVEGEGIFEEGTTVTVTATANDGYIFTYWTEGNAVVSEDASYTFTITTDRDLVANFEEEIVYYTVTLTANPAEGGEVAGEGTYEEGTEVTIEASANDGYTFAFWTEGDEIVSTEASYTFIINEDHDFVANFEEVIVYYEVTVVANPAEGGEVAGEGTYEEGTEVTVVATANDGYYFTYWTEGNAVVSEDASYTFTVTADRDLVANFEEEIVNYFTVTLTANPAEGGEVTGEGTYEEGTEVTVVATANDGYYFTYWTEGDAIVSEDAYYTFTLTEDRDLVANFEEVIINYYTVTLTANPVEGGTVEGEGTYEEGTLLTVTATANDGYIFTYWTEGNAVVSEDASYTFTVTADRDLVANFEEVIINYYTVTLTANPVEGGTVEGEGTYEEGTLLTVTATANDGYIFTYWTEGNAVVSEDASYTFTVMSDRDLVANFEEVIINYYTVTLTANPAEGGIVTGEGTYEEGTLVTVTAIANDSYVFVNWTEGDIEVSTDASYTFAITDDHDLVANFILPGILGDVNEDNVVNVADVQAVASYLYGYYLPTFNVINADANQDGVINIGDIQAILLIIQNNQPDKSMGGKPVIYTIENGVLNISLTEELSAMQIMVDAPIEIANTDVFDGFSTVIDRVQGTDSYMLLAYSLDGKTVKPGKYAILNIADGTIEQMIFSTPTAATVDGIEGDPLGIGEETVTANVYPNPTHGMITIEAENMSEIVISNMMGQIVARYADINGSSANINMNGFEKGTYLVRIITGSSVIVKNVVKM
jgi:helix-turn-helix protein